MQDGSRLHKGFVQFVLLEVRKKLDKNDAPGTWHYSATFGQEDKAVLPMFDSLLYNHFGSQRSSTETLAMVTL